VATALLIAGASSAHATSRGDVSVLALIPSPGLPRSGDISSRSSVPFDSPSGVAFLGTRLIVANQSYFAGSKANQALLALETGEVGAPVYVPSQPPAHQKHKRKRHERPHHKRRHRNH
jgi:hypothetical protein